MIIPPEFDHTSNFTDALYNWRVRDKCYIARAGVKDVQFLHAVYGTIHWRSVGYIGPINFIKPRSPELQGA